MTEEQLKYKTEQRERMKSYIVGSKDSSGNTISKVFSKGDEYIIYEIATKNLSDSIKVLIDTEIEDNKIPIENFSSVREKFTKIKGLLYKVVDDTSIKARIGHILTHAINGKPDEANNQFDDLIQEIESEYSNQSKHRINYLLTTLFLLLVSLSISALVYYNNLLLDKQILRELIYISSFALIGGFISISRKLKSTIFQKDIKKQLYVYYAIERMTIACIAGLVLYFAMKSNLVFGIVQELEKPIFGYLVFAAVAGFSETLIPNILIKLEDENK
jgi:hypothetical protein